MADFQEMTANTAKNAESNGISLEKSNFPHAWEHSNPLDLSMDTTGNRACRDSFSRFRSFHRPTIFRFFCIPAFPREKNPSILAGHV
jgi:hypothetical protein